MVFKDTLPSDARCFGLSLINNPQHLVLKALKDILSTPWQPRANHAILGNNTTLTWLLDSGASHHVTSDLSNLFLHSPYQGSDDIMIGDGSALPITHTGSTTISTSSRTFTLENVLCVPSMQKNLISIYQFCINNYVSVEFSLSAF